MEAIELIINLLEKVSVLVATSLVLVLLRPAEVWLSETGRFASLRRRAFILAIFGPLAIWGIFLGFELGDQNFNIRAIGIIVAGFLGGRLVGSLVGALAGMINALIAPPELAFYMFAASVIDGLVAGLIARKFGVNVRTIILGAIAAQLVHHVTLGAVFLAVDAEAAIRIASNVELHAAKIAANTVGVILFMGLLGLTRELDQAREDAVTSRAQVRSARLEALQYQLQPHFLFNLLNTLAYLIRTDPVRARELTLDLSEFLRYTLSRDDQETHLRDELEQIERYVELERARFGEGLVFVASTIDQDLAHRIILPPLILQPLVENAIRHGAREGSVRVDVRVAPDARGDVWIRVLDDGPGPMDESEKQRSRTSRRAKRHRSVGLENVRERLERFFDGSVTLTLRHRNDGQQGACAEFCIPNEALRTDSKTLTDQARTRLKEAVSPRTQAQDEAERSGSNDGS